MTIKFGSVPMIFNHQRFGNDALARRLHLKLSGREVAALADMESSLVYKYERGVEPNMKVDNFLRLCNVFDLDPRDYFELER